MNSPCQNCPYRKLTCHDHCDEYTEWHDVLVTAREALRASKRAVDLLIEENEKRKKRMNRRSDR